jgi:hypothetical protein
MVVSEKRHQKTQGAGYQRMLDKNDPFDQLILELGQKGALDVCVVGIGDKQPAPNEREYSKRTLRLKGRHSS